MFQFIWQSRSPRQRKLVTRLAAVILIYGVAGFFILPPIIRAVAVKQLSKQLDREVSIQKIKLNPFALSVAIDGLLIKDKDGQPFVSWDEVYVNFQLSSFFGKAWVFKEISTTKPFVRAQMNKDGTFNFTDLITKFVPHTTNAAPAQPSKPLVVHIERLHIGGASASVTDLTMRKPFARVIGPLDVTLENFGTDPDNKNPYSFSGRTDAGETFSWSGYFYLDPVRSSGELTLNNINLNKYAPIYEDFVNFDIRDGSVALHANYELEWGATNHAMAVTNTAFALRNFKLAKPGASNNVVELLLFGVTGVNIDLQTRQAEIGSVFAREGNLFVSRDKNNAINVVELSKPSTNALVNSPGGIIFLLHSVTNAVAMLLNSTNLWRATVHEVSLTDCGLHLEDMVNLRPAKLDLTDINVSVKNISNVPTTNLTAEVSINWNTNGTIKTEVVASFSPPTADISLAITNLDLGTLDPYLEPKVNLLILGSKVGLTGQIRLRTPENGLPQVTFSGDERLDDFHTVDGALDEDLLKWDSVRVSGIKANLNPPSASIREIALDNVYARVIIETNKAINLLTALQPAETNAPSAITNAPVAPVVVAKKPAAGNKFAALAMATNRLDSSSLPKVSIGSIVISNAAFRFTDRSMNPNVNLAIQQAGGTISGISTEESQPAEIDLHALVDNVGPADITGRINPFSSTATNEVKISVKNMDLTPTSPYSGKFAGYRIARGKLNLDLTYQLVGKKLSSKNVITLDQFTFGEKVDSADATHLPVRLAIAILKDRDGKIVLDVPIEGSIDDPKFRIGKVVVRALLNILTKVATSPFSLLGAVFGGGGEELAYQDFAPGSADLSADSTNKLDSLVKGLYARPALQLEISGSIDPANDREGLKRAALEKQLRTREWQSLGKSAQAATTPDQVVLTPSERTSLIRELYDEAQAAGKITPAIIAANTNLVAAVARINAQINASRPKNKKGAELLLNSPESSAPEPAIPAPAVAATAKLAPPADPKEVLLLAITTVSDDDLEALEAERAQAVRDYLLATGKVEATRLFLTQNQTGGVRSDGSRVYVQFQ